MTLNELKQYFVGQRLIIKCYAFCGPEVFELHITGVDDDRIHCYYRYLESVDHEGDSGNITYERWTLDDMVTDCWNGVDDWDILGWLPIKPINSLPEELFVI